MSSSCVGKRVDGIVVTARRADRREKLTVPAHDMPVIYVFSQIDDPDAYCLLPDDEGGAVLATEHLIGLGRRRIAHVTGPERFEAVRLRRNGYRKALAAAGVAEIEGFYLPGVWSEGWGREAVAQLFKGGRQRRPTRSSAATTRSRAARPMRCASAASSCRTRSRSSASTTGRSWPTRRGRR